jgi:hypothetical protein
MTLDVAPASRRRFLGPQRIQNSRRDAGATEKPARRAKAC